MDAVFVILAGLTVASAAAAMGLRNLVHCALSLAVAFAGLAVLYLRLSAQFVGLVQVLVYIGAVAILVVFAILLTRGGGPSAQPVFSSSWVVGGGVALVVFCTLTGVIVCSSAFGRVVAFNSGTALEKATVKKIGAQLMTQYVLPLEVIGLLLTAALIGAVIIAMQERRKS